MSKQKWIIHWRIASIGLCVRKDGKVYHLINECSKLAQKEYKNRHDGVEKGSTGNCAKD